MPDANGNISIHPKSGSTPSTKSWVNAQLLITGSNKVVWRLIAAADGKYY